MEETGKIFRNILSVRSILKLLLSSSAGGPVFYICKYLQIFGKQIDRNPLTCYRSKEWLRCPITGI